MFRFCEKCISETTDESPGDVTTIHGIGTTLRASRWLPWGQNKGKDKCNVCGSVIMWKWFEFIVPIKLYGRYRIIFTQRKILGIFGSTKYIGRRLRDDHSNLIKNPSYTRGLFFQLLKVIVGTIVFVNLFAILLFTFISLIKNPEVTCKDAEEVWIDNQCLKKTELQKVKKEKWSVYQGEMTLKTANAKCASLRFRLPLIEEFDLAKKAGMTKIWKCCTYWTSEELSSLKEYVYSIDYGYSFGVNKTESRHVRCIR